MGFPEKEDFMKLVSLEWGMLRRRLSRRKRARRRRTLALVILAVLVITASAGVLLFQVVIAHFKSGLPSVATITANNFSQETEIFDRHNQLLWRFTPDLKRVSVNLSELSDDTKNAFIAAEDQRFFEHRGLDYLSILRALMVNARTGQLRQGASTITQQLARLLYLDNSPTFGRKAREAILAEEMEKSLTKDQILELYLNAIPFGSNIYGVEAASREFFNKSSREINIAEAAILAALQKAPTTYFPFGGDVDALINRQEVVLRTMYERGYLTQVAANEALNFPLKFDAAPRPALLAPHFVFGVLDDLRANYGGEILRQGLSVTTTLDQSLQKRLEATITDFIKTHGANLMADNAAAVVLDAKRGEVLALLGSYDYSDPNFGAFNAAKAWRQPGSTLKPLIYALAIDRGLLNARSVLLDAPISFGPYAPRNYDGTFHGNVSLRNALIYSYNIPAIKTLNSLGVNYAVERLNHCGLDLDRDAQLSLAIGGAAARLYDLTAAYSVFTNGGVCVPPRALSKVLTRQGTVILDRTDLPQGTGTPFVRARAARDIDSILRGTKRAFGEYARIATNPRYDSVGIKTGTSNGPRDAWVIGYSDQYIVGVWVGNHDNRPLKENVLALSVATPLWVAIFEAVNDQLNTS